MSRRIGDRGLGVHVATGEVRLDEAVGVDPCPAQVGALELGAGQPGTGEVGTAEIGTGEVGVGQIGLTQPEPLPDRVQRAKRDPGSG